MRIEVAIHNSKRRTMSLSESDKLSGKLLSAGLTWLTLEYLLFIPAPHRFYPLPITLSYIRLVSTFTRDRQLQVGDKYSYLFNLRANIFKSEYLNTHFVHNNLITVIKPADNRLKTDYSHACGLKG